MTEIFNENVEINGSSDVVQLQVKGNTAGQTEALQVWQDSTGTGIASVQADGKVESTSLETNKAQITGTADEVQLAIVGSVNQVEPLQSWEDSSDGVVASIFRDGRIQTGSTNATGDAQIEVFRDEDSAGLPKRGLNITGRIQGALSSIVSWSVHELFLLGSAGVQALHSALRVRIVNQNTGTDNENGELRAGEFEVLNEGGPSSPVPLATGIDVRVQNGPDGHVETVYGVRVDVSDQNSSGGIDDAYAIHATGAKSRFDDVLELNSNRETSVPSDVGVAKIYRRSNGQLYATVDGGTEYLLSVAPTPDSGDEDRFLRGDSTWQTPAAGSVTEVALQMPSEFDVDGSPITDQGTLQVSWNTQTANRVLASPDGFDDYPTFRSLVSDDIPGLPASKITSEELSLEQGGTAADLSSSGPGFLKQAATGSAITVGTLGVEDISNLSTDKITSGVLPVGRGGTGAGTLSANGLVVGNATGSVTSVAPGSNGNILKSDGTAWQSGAPSFDASAITDGTLPVSRGGTGAATLSANALVVGNDAGAVTTLAPGTSGNFVRSAGTSWESAPIANGNLPIVDVAHGGTGVSSASANQVFAAPNGASGAPSFRTLVTNDIPWASPGNIGSTAPAGITATDFGFAASTILTVSSGAITRTQSFHRVAYPGEGEGDATLSTIHGGSEGDVLFLRRHGDDPGQHLFVDSSGNIELSDGRVEVRQSVVMVFIYDGNLGKWIGGICGGRGIPDLNYPGFVYDRSDGPSLGIARFQIGGSSDPTANDDVNDGFQLLSLWQNNSSEDVFICAKSTSGAAVWKPITRTSIVDTTTNATAKALITTPALATNTALMIEGNVIGATSTRSAALNARFSATFRRGTGNVQVAGQFCNVAHDSTSAPNVAVAKDNATQTGRIEVTGVAAETWNWKAVYTITAL